MRTRYQIICTVIAGSMIGLFAPCSRAIVDDKDFEALKELVNKQGQRIEQLEGGREQDRKALDDARKVHEQDKQQIEQLKQQLGETQKTVSEAASKADAASAKITGPPATHNFTMVGDAEVQF